MWLPVAANSTTSRVERKTCGHSWTGEKHLSAMNATKTYQYVGAQTGVYFGRRVVLSSFLHLFVDEAAVSRGVVFTQVV